MSNAYVDVIAPKCLIIPQILNGGSMPLGISGAIYMSGAKLYFTAGNTVVAITSA